MKYLVVGLGNIGAEYHNTRHNIGFTILDALASASSIFFDTQRYASVCTLKHKGRTLILAKPTTYMNLSGKAVQYWMQAEKIPLENVLILTDDLSLDFGKIRIRGKGSDGGHNGLKHINQTLNTNEYTRLRFGIGNQFSNGKQVDYVLGQWTSEEERFLPERIDLCCEAIKSFCSVGLQHTMNNFNNK